MDHNDGESINQLNPLDIPYILQQVLQNLPTFHLSKSRLVSKYWNSEATPLLLKCSKITLQSEDSLQQLLPTPTPLLLPHSVDIKHKVKLKSPLTQTFIREHGPNIKSLDISFHHEYGAQVLSEILPYLTNLEELFINGRSHFLYEESSRDLLIGGFPHLRSLFIYDSSFDLHGPQEPRMTNWAENMFHILASTPKLEKLYYAPFLEARAKMFFEIVKNCQPVGHHAHLRYLHVNHLWMRPEDTAYLRAYPLRYFHLVLTSQLPRQNLNELLNSLYDTLRELTLTFTDGTSCLEFHPIQPLDKISKLSLIGYDGPLVISNAPNVKLFVMSLPDSMIHQGSVGIGEGLEELEIYDFQVKYELECLRVLFRRFWRLKVLKVNNLSSGILRVIYSCLPGLVELRSCFHQFYGGEVGGRGIDVGLSGISEGDVVEELLDVCWERDDRGIGHLRGNPWIGDLRYLKHLTLEVGSISDFGVVLGIARCRKLEELVLKNTKSYGGDHLEESRENDPRTNLTDRTLRVISEMESLYYLKIEGYLHMFSNEEVERIKERLGGREVIIC